MSLSEKRFKAVLAANQELQMKARGVNLRAGEEVFLVMSVSQWKEWLAARLAGVTCKAEVPDWDLLRLPALNAEKIALVFELNPSTVSVLGREVSVEYYAGCAPRVRIDFQGQQGRDWLNLPDEIRLPGGREVLVCSVVEDCGRYIEAPSSQFKSKVREHLNRGQWEAWTDRPVITVPTEITDDLTLPGIITAVYGNCVVTGDPLEAFGTLTAYRYWSSDPITWKPEWFRIRAEAEEAFSKAQVELEKAKVEAREWRERESVQKAAEAVKAKAQLLYRELPYDDGAGDLRDRLYNRAYIMLDMNRLQQWITETEAIIAEAEVVLAEIRRKKEKAAEVLRKLARPILRPGETISERTVYGMPCNDDGPCKPESATSWRLYSHRDGELRPYKGYRSTSCGKTFRELVYDYMRGEQDVEAVLASLTDTGKPTTGEAVVRSVRPMKPQAPFVAGSLNDLASKWGGRLK